MGIKPGIQIIFCKIAKVLGGVLAKFNKCNGPDEHFKLVLWRICWIEIILRLKKIISGQENMLKSRKKIPHAGDKASLDRCG